jgi:RNA polymerase sigma factor (sigma-70 family)
MPDDIANPAEPSHDPARVADCLRRWHEGDAAALDELLRRELPWIKEMVKRRMGAILLQAESSSDLVQDVVVSILRNGPRFVIGDQRQLRAFLARVAENVILDRHAHLTAQRRDLRREEPLPSRDSVVVLDGTVRPVTRPSEAASGNEQKALVWISLRLLDPADREVIRLRDYEELSFVEIAERIGSTEDAVRMRYNRALPRLAQTLWELRNQRVSAVLERLEQQGETPPA